MGSGKKGSARLGSHARDTPTSGRERGADGHRTGRSGGPRSLDGEGDRRVDGEPRSTLSRGIGRVATEGRPRGLELVDEAGLGAARPRRTRGHARSASDAPTSVKATSWSPRRAARMATSSRSAMSGPRSLTSRYVMTAAAYARPASSSRSRSRSASPRLFWAIPAFSRSPTSLARRIASSQRRRADSWSPAIPSIQARLTWQVPIRRRSPSFV